MAAANSNEELIELTSDAQGTIDTNGVGSLETRIAANKQAEFAGVRLFFDNVAGLTKADYSLDAVAALFTKLVDNPQAIGAFIRLVHQYAPQASEVRGFSRGGLSSYLMQQFKSSQHTPATSS